MRKVIEKPSEVYEFAILYTNHLRELEVILRQFCTTVKLQIGEYILDSVDELEKLPKQEFLNFVFEGSNAAGKSGEETRVIATIPDGKRYFRIYVESGDVEARGIHFQLCQAVRGHAQQPEYLKMARGTALLAGVIVVLVFATRNLATLGGGLIALAGAIACALLWVVGDKARAVVRNGVPSDYYGFFRRNAEELKLDIVKTCLGIVIGALGTLLMQRIVPRALTILQELSSSQDTSLVGPPPPPKSSVSDRGLP